MARARVALAAAALAGLLAAGPAVGQGAPPPAPLPAGAPAGIAAPILAVDLDALYRGSAWGRRAAADLAAAGAAVQAENQRLEAELTAAEAALTERRAGMDAAAFRAEAEAFDRRAQTIRRERAEAVDTLNAAAAADEAAFFAAAAPEMQALLAERGALALIDRRALLAAAPALDVTAALIARLDAALGPGPAAPDPVPAD